MSSSTKIRNGATRLRDKVLSILANSQASQEVSLPTLYEWCAALNDAQDQLVASALSDPSLLAAAVSLFNQLEQQVINQGIFSANEDQDDLSTMDMKYLLAPYFRASLLISAPVSGGALQRQEQVTAAASAISKFLQRLQQYGLLGELGTRLYQQEEDVAGPLDPASKRAAKVERFKQEKAINAALQTLQHSRGRQSQSDDVDQEAGPVGGPGGLDEEDERQLWKLRLELAALKAMDLRQALQEEAELLQHAVSAAAASGLSPSQQEAQGQERQQQAQVLAALRKVAADLGGAGAGGVGSRREALRQAALFHPSHMLPTMTLEEFTQLEIADAQRRQQAEQAAQEHSRAEEEAGSDDEGKTLKARAWDDYKDANPRGWGNSKLRPCG